MTLDLEIAPEESEKSKPSARSLARIHALVFSERAPFNAEAWSTEDIEVLASLLDAVRLETLKEAIELCDRVTYKKENSNRRQTPQGWFRSGAAMCAFKLRELAKGKP